MLGGLLSSKDLQDMGKSATASAHRQHRRRSSTALANFICGFRDEDIELPVKAHNPEADGVVWRLPSYNTVHNVLTNPIYAAPCEVIGAGGLGAS